MFELYVIDYLPDQPHPGGRQWSYTLPLPEGVGFRLLAGPGYDPPWGVFHCGAELPLSAHVRAVPEDTCRALHAAAQYPPALAPARDDLAAAYHGRPAPTDAAFCAAYAAALRAHLRRQPQAGHVLAVSATTEAGLIEPGGVYWVLGHAPAPGQVRYVLGDRVATGPASGFALTSAQLAALPPA